MEAAQDADEAVPAPVDPLEAEPDDGTRKAGPSADGPRVKRRKSELMKVIEMQEAKSEARQATQLETQARWRQVDSNAKTELVNQQIELRYKELEQRRVEKEMEHQLQRDRLELEKKQREEENRIRALESQNQRDTMMKMMELFASKK